VQGGSPVCDLNYWIPKWPSSHSLCCGKLQHTKPVASQFALYIYKMTLFTPKKAFSYEKQLSLE